MCEECRRTKALVALSGGLDSCTVTSMLLDQGCEVIGVSFKYGSQHNKWELEAASKIADFFERQYPHNFKYRGVIDTTPIFEGMHTPFLAENDKPIPEGHYNADNMKDTVVPCRNVVFTSILAGIAEDTGCDVIALGIHRGDHHTYSDTRPEFYNPMEQAILAATENKVKFIAPILNMDKKEVVQVGIALNSPYHLTRTCYEKNSISCGRCGSCNERLEAFKLAGYEDPIIYDNDKYNRNDINPDYRYDVVFFADSNFYRPISNVAYNCKVIRNEDLDSYNFVTKDGKIIITIDDEDESCIIAAKWKVSNSEGSSHSISDEKLSKIVNDTSTSIALSECKNLLINALGKLDAIKNHLDNH